MAITLLNLESRESESESSMAFKGFGFFIKMPEVLAKETLGDGVRYPFANIMPSSAFAWLALSFTAISS